MKNLILLIISWLFFFSCGETPPKTGSESQKQDTSGATTPASAPESPTLKRVILIVDGSNSLNTPARDNIMQKALNVFDALGEMHDIRVFSTAEGTKTPPVFQWKKVAPTKPSLEKIFLSKTLPEKRAELQKAVNDVFNKSNNGSYILHAIQSAYSNLQGSDVADQTLILVLSDMLECSPKYYGCSESKQGFEKMIKSLDKSSLAEDCPLSKSVPYDNLAFCVISMNSEQNFIELSSSPACGKFWEAVFQKMGYSDGPKLVTDIGEFTGKIRF